MSVEGCEVMWERSRVETALTSSTALLLVTEPALLVTTTEKLPAFGSATALKVSTALVAPAMFDAIPAPLERERPGAIDTDGKRCGVADVGRDAGGLRHDAGRTAMGAPADTLSIAALLVALPAALLTVTL